MPCIAFLQVYGSSITSDKKLQAKRIAEQHKEAKLSTWLQNRRHLLTEHSGAAAFVSFSPDGNGITFVRSEARRGPAIERSGE